MVEKRFRLRLYGTVHYSILLPQDPQEHSEDFSLSEETDVYYESQYERSLTATQ